ncbi:MAG: VCBS repeat-containing protein, partial [Planctomycetota bacterium]|nr:VCBS repeat-containing protein [Planctomycetota bacterium]
MLDSSSIGLGKPFSVAVIDEMGDGFLDVAVGELEVVDTIGGGGPLPDRVVVYRNDGTGLQLPIVALSPAFGPAIDNIGDADGNGFEDLGVAQLDADDVVILGNTLAGFTIVTSIDVGGGSSSVIAPDLNGDSVTDLAATIINEYAVVVRMGLAPLTYGEMTRYNVGPVPRSIQQINLPNDSLLDLVLAGPEDLNFLENLGGGNLEATRGFDVGDKPVFIQVVDLDLDGDMDIVTIDHFQENLTFLEGDGNGNFEKVATVPLAPTATELPGNFDIADVDGDLLPDIVVAIHELAEVRILRNNGTVGGFTPALPGDVYQMGSLLLGIQITDLNQDPFPDVVVASSGDDSICIMLGAAGGIFTVQPPIPTPFRPAALLSEDVNNDGFLDVACTADTGAVPGEDPVLGLLSGDGTGALFVEGFLPVTTLGQTLHCGDFDEDGLCDLAAGQPGDTVDSFLVFMNQGAFTFTETSIQVGGNPGALSVADVNRDGHDDIIVPTGLGELRVVFGDGTG